MDRLGRIRQKTTKTAVGLMSGTSVDGIDAVLLDISRTPPKAENRRKNAGLFGVSDKCPELPELTVKERAFITFDYPEKVRQKLLTLAAGNTGGSEELCVLNFYLGELFADACFEVCKKAGISIGSVDFIGSHGHTVFHAPQERLVFGKSIKSTLQIGEGAVIAERTGCITVSDFRVRDTAAGGFGAPLVPFSEYLLYRERGKVIALQNIGGIGNITILPADENINGIIAFDTGPGNMIIDGLVRILTGGKQNYDKDGAIALRGKVDEELLGFLKKDPYLYKAPPKTTGREHYTVDFIQAFYRKGKELNLAPETIVRTASYYTAFCIARSLTDFKLPQLQKLIVGGGGSKNPVILAHLRELLPHCAVMTNEDIGKNGDSKEACAFAVLAHETLYERPNNVPSATGAHSFVVMGKISF